jgi:hypothetical protein
MVAMQMMTTLWPSFPHFPRFARDTRLSGIRLNSAMIDTVELDQELERIANSRIKVPLYFDVKGRQLRVTKVFQNPDHLDLVLNHPIRVDLPTPVLFKGGEDTALLESLKDTRYLFGKGVKTPNPTRLYNRLIFAPGAKYGPKAMVRPGESLHIRDKSLVVGGAQFTQIELQKIEKVKAAGFTRWFLSYVENQKDVDEFLELVGRDAEVYLKIENLKGLDYVAREYKKRENLKLVAAQGDLYVEVDQPHQILEGLKLIIAKDAEALAGSRMMLSVVHSPVPSCADFSQLAWLWDIGYRNFMLCDEICLKEELLSAATNAMYAFKTDYAK